MLTKLNFRIHIRQVEEATVKHTFSDVTVSAAVCALESCFSFIIRPYPVLELRDHLILLFKNFHRLILVDNTNLGFRIGCIINSDRFHVEDVFEQVKHIHSIRAINRVVVLFVLTMLTALTETGFLGNLPNTGYVIVPY